MDTPVIDSRKAKIKMRFSIEYEWRELEFLFIIGEGIAFENIYTFIKKYDSPEAYWEGLLPNVLYAEVHIHFKPLGDIIWDDIDYRYIAIPNKEEQEAFYSLIKNYAPQKHKPKVEAQYVPEEAYEIPIEQFPKQYYPPGFPKKYLTVYDKEMQMAYSIEPGFSTPAPDIKTVKLKLRKLLPIIGKPHVIGMLNAFGMESLLDIGINLEMLYYLNAAIEQEYALLKE